MEENTCMKFLASCINRRDDSAGQWHAFPISGRKDDAITLCVFTNVNTLFGLRKEAMAIFWAEAGQAKNKCLNIVLSHNGRDELKELALLRSSI